MAKAQRKTHNGSSQKRAIRPTWEGHLRLSLVTCPVALYTATERAADVHFHLINPKTNNRIACRRSMPAPARPSIVPSW